MGKRSVKVNSFFPRRIFSPDIWGSNSNSAQETFEEYNEYQIVSKFAAKTIPQTNGMTRNQRYVSNEQNEFGFVGNYLDENPFTPAPSQVYRSARNKDNSALDDIMNGRSNYTQTPIPSALTEPVRPLSQDVEELENQRRIIELEKEELAVAEDSVNPSYQETIAAQNTAVVDVAQVPVYEETPQVKSMPLSPSEMQAVEQAAPQVYEEPVIRSIRDLPGFVETPVVEEEHYETLTPQEPAYVEHEVPISQYEAPVAEPSVYEEPISTLDAFLPVNDHRDVTSEFILDEPVVYDEQNFAPPAMHEAPVEEYVAPQYEEVQEQAYVAPQDVVTPGQISEYERLVQASSNFAPAEEKPVADFDYHAINGDKNADPHNNSLQFSNDHFVEEQIDNYEQEEFRETNAIYDLLMKYKKKIIIGVIGVFFVMFVAVVYIAFTGSDSPSNLPVPENISSTGSDDEKPVIIQVPDQSGGDTGAVDQNGNPLGQ